MMARPGGEKFAYGAADGAACATGDGGRGEAYSRVHYFPAVAFLDAPPGVQHACDDTLEAQLEVFAALALGYQPVSPVSLAQLDAAMAPEATFYTCRAIRRLLLGRVFIPCRLCLETPGTAGFNLKYGSPFLGSVLIIDPRGFLVAANARTDVFLPAVLSMEATDPVVYTSFCAGSQVQLRALTCRAVTKTALSPELLFRCIARYINMVQFEECFASFVETLPAGLAKRALGNYEWLLRHVRNLPCCLVPPVAGDHKLQFFMFSVRAFVFDLPHNEALHGFKAAVLHNAEKYPRVLMRLCQCSGNTPIEVSCGEIVTYQNLLNQFAPHLAVKMSKKCPKKTNHVVLVSRARRENWLLYPPACPVYRLVMCLSVAPMVTLPPPARRAHESLVANRGACVPLTPARVLACLFERMNYAPKDNPIATRFPMAAVTSRPLRAPLCSSFCARSVPTAAGVGDLRAEYSHVQPISFNGFKINIFNTNMVINTKIQCKRRRGGYESILALPRLTNNFVMRKFSVKEPACTISMFYSEDFCEGAAINVNISGDVLNFLHAMGVLKCILPVKTIFPVCVSNWNSTLDLHGLENQQLVRHGRKDVFWTTNFPSVVSTKAGFSVSWFKAATATVSRIHGTNLTRQILNEAHPILGHRDARINLRKNGMFTNLEMRNRYQLQAIHKRFLECLYESMSFLRLSTAALERLVWLGVFDFSKRIISHSKNKHECAISGYKLCNVVSKLLVRHKKVRLDELGRNANFLTFFPHLKNVSPVLKNKIMRHIIRRLGLRWQYHNVTRLATLRAPIT
ncbi:protein UL87 [Common bottlenose dolphin gammaherpesvirus 1 strain Sarasota]|uniref:Protein UL87 n=1 Tax=Common bottlenose dolphin gammaherpesvirus 1 strain Sarasota TaxID=2022783 RepID=A0A1Z1NE08_9GAMA|nr:protein UL87 [Common bottlenose dolphin gammaherpesvirus 1 strain Sarasota]ARW78087.1 protein UL87 [Common bottlenose dolphin gammaherpesvirus 1 strain Sarasota]